jgi:DNA-binding transcriptional ArsR family regulator
VTARIDSPSAPSGADVETAAAILRLLGDRTRLLILAVLRDGELPVSVIAETVQRPLPAVSQHLAKLRAGGLVTTRREGTTVYYAVMNEHVSALVHNAFHHAEHLRYPEPPHHR